MDLSIAKSPIFSVGSFLINKSFFTPNTDILRFGLLRHGTHEPEFDNTNALIY